MSPVSVRLFGGAAEAFGESEVKAPPAGTLAGLLEWLAENGPGGQSAAERERLRDVLDQCSFFIDGEHHKSLDAALPGDCKVDVLPPFAGG